MAKEETRKAKKKVQKRGKGNNERINKNQNHRKHLEVLF